MYRRQLLIGLALATGAIAFVPAAVAQDSAAGVLKRAADAMGAPNTIRYLGDGTGWTYGQAFMPGMPWPKITVHNQARTINYATGSMREEITLSRAEPKGGGGSPLQGQQRNDQYVSGSFAWNQVGPAPAAGPRFVADRTHQLWITPHGVINAALRNNATVQWRGNDGKSLAAVSFTDPGKYTATAFIDEDYLVERVESRLPDAVLGEVGAAAVNSGYRDFGGVKFPTRIQQWQGGHPTLDLAVKEVQPNAPADIQVPDAVRGVGEKTVLTDGARTIELHKIGDSIHTDTFLMVWLPKERLLVQADAYTPLPPGAKPPSPPNANNVNLVENIERLKLPVERILPIHGRIVPLEELYTTASRTPPK
jgi:hypothetical protein